MKNEVVFLSAVRTAIGSYGGTLKLTSPTVTGTAVMAEAMRRAGVMPEDVSQVVMGNVIPTVPQDAYLARVCALQAGIPHSVPSHTVNHLCGSGLQAIISAAQSILLGASSIAVAGGAEAMSRGPKLLPKRSTPKKDDEVQVLLPYTQGVLQDPLGCYPLGQTGDNIAALRKISRREQDEWALESHRRAAQAMAEGRFKEQILPLEVSRRKGPVLFDHDEDVRPEATMDYFTSASPAFHGSGSVTNRNAASANDAASAVVLADAGSARDRGLRPLARLVSWGQGGVDPQYMGLGPVPAVRQALQRAGLHIGDMAVIEANEANAAQACAVARELELDLDRLNPNGSGIAMGHPAGATGAIITTKAIYELQRIKGRYALITTCIGGGQGIAMIIERLN